MLCPCQQPLTSVAVPIWVQDGPAYIQTFMQVLRNVSKEDTVEYVLAMMDQLLTGQHEENLTAVHLPLCALLLIHHCDMEANYLTAFQGF